MGLAVGVGTVCLLVLTALYLQYPVLIHTYTPCQAVASSAMPPEGHNGHGHSIPDRARHLFTVPAPIKRIFDKFPLTTLPPNDLPQCPNTSPQGNKLFVFTDPVSAKRGRPSFNPQCLKWQVGAPCSMSMFTVADNNRVVQAYLKFVGIDFDVIPSNNHASPSGALPFLIPSLPVGTDTPIPSSKLQKWAIEEVHCEEEQQLNVRFEVYASLLDSGIRNAWVC